MTSRTYKAVLIGDIGVGKSSLMNRLIRGVFHKETPATVGASFYRHRQVSPEGTMNVIEIWDTAGNRNYKSLIPSYLRGADVVFLVYDVTSLSSYKELANWENMLSNLTYTTIPPVKFLVCNKVDRCSTWADHKPAYVDDHYQLWNLGQRFAEEHNFCFLSTSALMNYGIEEMMDYALERVNLQKQIPLVAEPETPPRVVILSEPTDWVEKVKSDCAC